MDRKAYRLADIAARFGGQVVGDADTQVQQIGTLEKATAGQIAFLANAKYRHQLENSRASAVILSKADADATDIPRIVCDNPYSYFAKLSAFLNPLPECVPGIHPSAVIGKGAKISPQAHIGPQVTVARWRDHRRRNSGNGRMQHRRGCDSGREHAPLSERDGVSRLRHRQSRHRCIPAR